MREVKLSDLPPEIVSKILEKTPLSEDIGIFDNDGALISIIIRNKTYKYLLAKIEEDEEAIDQEELKDFNSEKEKNETMDFDDLIKGDK